ncbi:MAG: GNAT family N-acetyltransferase, partial [Xanthobacteraceae bacterium]|nr:GNAT family N-acetyltransferase [Xanthobacteraceae bacterium]
ALALLQDGGIEDYRARYLVLRTKDGRIAAHTTAYIIETDLLIFSQGVLKLLLDKIRRVLPKFLRPSILECGCPVSAGNPICLREGIAYADVLAPLCDALEQIAAKEGIRFLLLRDFVDEELAELSELAGHGFSRIPNLPSTELAIKWRSFEEYVLAMRSRHRQKIRRGLRFAQRAGLSARWTNEFAGMVDELARQWSNVNAQAKEYSRDRLTPEFFRNLNSAFGSRCRLLQILHDERMVAHALVVSDGPLLRWILFGRENGEARDGAYFLVIARIIAFAIEQGSERIEMGLTTYSPKTDFGARMVPLWMFARVRGVLPRMLVPMLFRLLNPVPDIRDRACFRSPEDAVLPEPAS